MVITPGRIRQYIHENSHCQIGKEALDVVDLKVKRMLDEVIYWTGGGKRIHADDVHRIIIRTEKGV